MVAPPGVRRTSAAPPDIVAPPTAVGAGPDPPLQPPPPRLRTSRSSTARPPPRSHPRHLRPSLRRRPSPLRPTIHNERPTTNSPMTYASTRRAAPPATLRRALRQRPRARRRPLPARAASRRSRTAGAAPRRTPTSPPRCSRPWLDGEVPDGEAAVRDALSFPMPVERLVRRGVDGLFVLELFHGPTLSFKDVGARTLARCRPRRLLARRARPRSRCSSPRAATPAARSPTASRACRACAWCLLFPEGRVSEVQERQLVAERPGVTAVRVRRHVRRLPAARQGAPLPTRASTASAPRPHVRQLDQHRAPAAAEPYYVDAAAVGALTGDAAPRCSWCRAATSATSRRACSRTSPGCPSPGSWPRTTPTAPSSTTSAAPRFGPATPAPTRLERDGRGRAEQLRAPRPRCSPRTRAARARAGGSVTDDESRARRCAPSTNATGYLACPHTAVGLDAARRLREAGETAPLVVLATAHPAKFPDEVAAAHRRPPVRAPRPRAPARPDRRAPSLPRRPSTRSCG